MMSASEQTSASKRDLIKQVYALIKDEGGGLQPWCNMTEVEKEAVREFVRANPLPKLSKEDHRRIELASNDFLENHGTAEAVGFVYGAEYATLYERSNGQPDELSKAQERVKELEGVIESIIWSVRNEATIGTMIQNILLKANSTIQKHD